MRTLDNITEASVCPACRKNGKEKPGKGIIIPIAGTLDGEGNYEAEVFHLSCLDLMYFKDEGTLIQPLRRLMTLG